MANNNNRKIILSIHWGFSLGGVAKYAELINEVHDFAPVQIKTVCVVLKGRDYDASALQQLDAELIQIGSIADFSWLKRLVGIVRQEKPTALFTHGFNGHFAAWLTRALSGVPVGLLASYHGDYHATTFLRRLVAPVYNGFTNAYIRRSADAVVPVAEYCAQYLMSVKISSDKITVVHNGIPDAEVSEGVRRKIRSDWGIADDEILIGTASRIDPVKGIKYLVDAFLSISKNVPGAKLVLLGEGQERALLERKVEKIGLGNRVIFPGRRTDVVSCLEAFDVFALPSLAEYHSIGLLEAMRAGKAIVATNVGGNTESVRDSFEALVVAPGDSDALSVALIRLVKDSELRGLLGRAARIRFLECFTADRMARKTAQWLDAVTRQQI